MFLPSKKVGFDFCNVAYVFDVVGLIVLEPNGPELYPCLFA